VRSGGPGARIVSEIKQAAAVADGRGLVKVGRGAVGAPSHDAGPVIDIGDVVVVGRERVRAAGILASLVLRSGQGVRDAVTVQVTIQLCICTRPPPLAGLSHTNDLVDMFDVPVNVRHKVIRI